MRIVEYEGTIHQFPPDATDEEIQAALSGVSQPGLTAGTTAYLPRSIDELLNQGAYQAPTDDSGAERMPPGEKSALGFAKNIGKSGFAFAESVGNTVLHPVDSLSGMGQVLLGLISSALDASTPSRNSEVKRYLPYREVAEAFASALGERYGGTDKLIETLYQDPIGVAADLSVLLGGGGALLRGGGALLKGSNAAKTANVLTKAGGKVSALGQTIDPIAQTARGATMAISKGLEKTRLPERLYQSSLRPSLQGNASRVQRKISTGLEENLSVSRSGVEKLRSAIDELEVMKSELLEQATAKGKTIDPRRVAARVDDLANRLRRQVNPLSDLTDIGNVIDEFLATNPAPIPVARAQAMKSTTYGKLKNQYGNADKISTAKAAALKALSRGLKEELEQIIPELKSINFRESKFLDLESSLNYAVESAANRQISGPAAAVTGLAAGALAGDVKIGLSAAALQAVLSDPALRSRLAIITSRIQTRLPGKYKNTGIATAVNRINEYRNSLDAGNYDYGSSSELLPP